jgi:hypothetical protein
VAELGQAAPEESEVAQAAVAPDQDPEAYRARVVLRAVQPRRERRPASGLPRRHYCALEQRQLALAESQAWVGETLAVAHIR